MVLKESRSGYGISIRIIERIFGLTFSLDKSHWVSGYNFKMSYASLVSSPNDYIILLEVIGISPNGNFAHIDFDAATGELLLAEEEIEYSNGDVEWKSFN